MLLLRTNERKKERTTVFSQLNRKKVHFLSLLQRQTPSYFLSLFLSFFLSPCFFLSIALSVSKTSSDKAPIFFPSEVHSVYFLTYFLGRSFLPLKLLFRYNFPSLKLVRTYVHLLLAFNCLPVTSFSPFLAHILFPLVISGEESTQTRKRWL